jgi:thioredoxin 1
MSEPIFAKLDQFNFHHLLADASGSAMVIFSGPACGSCRAWKQLLAEYQQRNPEIQLFEVDVERDQALAAEFSVFHLPALFLYRDGHYPAQVECEATRTTLDSTLAELLKQPPQELP